jgi:hypothetical protein
MDVNSNIIAFARYAGVVVAGGVDLYAKNNDVYGNGVNWLGAPDPTGSDGNVSADPGFASPETGDWSLSLGSVCVDHGLSTQRPLDLAGRPRVQDGDMDGVAVQDMGAYELPPDKPPTASAGPSLTVECASPAGATVTLDGSGSSDPDSTPGTNDDIVSYEWTENPQGTLLGTGEKLSVNLPLGAHTITLRVKDRMGASSTSVVVDTVADTVPPALTLDASPTLLWPPNGALVPVQIRWQAQDRCDPNPTVTLAQVTSSEQDDALAAGGNIAGAQIGTSDGEVLLRADRLGVGPGRTYSLTYIATDASGNATPAQAVVTVPHDQIKAPRLR